MKVVHVLARLTHSGAERQFACSYRQWRDAGIEPVIVGMANGEHPLARVLEQAGYEVFTLPPSRSLRGLLALRRVLTEIKPEIVHIGSERAFHGVALVAVSCPSVKGVVRTVHSHFRDRGLLGSRRRLRRAFANRLGVIWVSVTDEVAESEREFSNNPTRVVEGFIDVDALVAGLSPTAGLAIREELGIDSNAFAVGLIGNCAPAKNHELVAEALARVVTPVHLLHVGHRKNATTAERDAWQHLPSGRHTVHHLGPRDNIPALLAACDLTLVPSLYEGQSLAAIESLCAGVPVIGADTIGLQWLSSLGPARCVPHDPKQWAEAIESAVTDPIAVTADAVIAARDRFRPERAVAEYAAVYEEAVRGRLLLRRKSGKPHVD
jgi:glycosyltransferase involved in cell wall biosynthesis